jgi:hypothetical protein
MGFTQDNKLIAIDTPLKRTSCCLPSFQVVRGCPAFLNSNWNCFRKTTQLILKN